MTHEETVTFHAREIQSYRQLPQMLYHISIKERDEPRPRAGLIRLREFIMKDAYSFDRDEEGSRRASSSQRGAYHRIFERCGLRGLRRRGRVGDDGRQRVTSTSSRPPVPARTRSSRARTATSPPTSRSRAAFPRAPSSPRRSLAPEEVETPGVKTCEALAEFLAIDVAATSKAMPVTTDDGTSCSRWSAATTAIEPAKLDAALGRPSRPATDEEIRAAFGASGGSLGPVGFDGEVVADEALRDGQFVAGANRDGWHLRGVEAGRDFQPRFADLRVGGARATPARTAAASCGSRPRSRWGTSSSSGRATRSRSVRRSSTRTARSAP